MTPTTPTAPTEQDIAAQIRRVGAAHKDYYEAASALLAYARVETDIEEMIHRLNRIIIAVEVLTQACEAIPESLGLLRGEQFPGIIDIDEEDIIHA